EARDIDINVIVNTGRKSELNPQSRPGDHEHVTCSEFEADLMKRLEPVIQDALIEIQHSASSDEMAKALNEIALDLKVYTSPFADSYRYVVDPLILLIPFAIVCLKIPNGEREIYVVLTDDPSCLEQFDRYKQYKRG
ncbi:MAG: hypothetical protein NZO16_01505, partial [Deltaproteobacteria bacterium]|nr:hypothetical protein [Deltaproteobacteria bacterium]